MANEFIASVGKITDVFSQTDVMGKQKSHFALRKDLGKF
jgi:hypothetical protein